MRKARATITPDEVSSGASFTIESVGSVQPICGFPLILYTRAVKDPFALLYEDGTLFVYGRDSFEIPDCLPAYTAVTHTYSVRDDLPPDDYVACLTFNIDPNGCGEVTVR